MKKSLVACTLLAVAAVMLSACSHGSKGPTDQEQILQRLQEGAAAMKAKDYAAFDKFVSPAFSCPIAADKAAMLDALKNADEAGLAEGLEIDLSQVTIEIDGDKCTAGPIAVSSNVGAISVTGYAVKENGVWMVTGGDGY